MAFPVLWGATALPDFSSRRRAEARRTGGRALAVQLLVAMEDRPWTIEADERGKPVVTGSSSYHVSIAHSGRLLVAAASIAGPVGIDVEHRKPGRDVDGLAGAAFGPRERATVAAEGAPAFYRIWTVREAIAKAVGTGLPMATDGIDRVPPVMPDGLLVDARDGWAVAHQSIAQEFSLALAIHTGSADEARAIVGRRLEELRLPKPSGSAA